MARSTVSESEEYVAATPVASPAVVESLRRVSWGAVFGGVALSLITQFLLSMLGIGIGVATLDPGTNDNPTAWLGGRSGTVIPTVTGLGLRASARRLP